MSELEELQEKVAALSAALAHPWPQTPQEMREWLSIRESALLGVDSAIREHNGRVAKKAIYEIHKKFTTLANHIWGQGIKDYSSNVVDALALWLIGPLFDVGGLKTDAWSQLTRATQEVDEILAAEKAKK